MLYSLQSCDNSYAELVKDFPVQYTAGGATQNSIRVAQVSNHRDIQHIINSLIDWLAMNETYDPYLIRKHEEQPYYDTCVYEPIYHNHAYKLIDRERSNLTR